MVANDRGVIVGATFTGKKVDEFLHVIRTHLLSALYYLTAA